MADTMRTARLHAVGEPMRIERVPMPRPRPTDVLVKVVACGVVPNLGNVLKHWQGWFPELASTANTNMPVHSTWAGSVLPVSPRRR